MSSFIDELQLEDFRKAQGSVSLRKVSDFRQEAARESESFYEKEEKKAREEDPTRSAFIVNQIASAKTQGNRYPEILDRKLEAFEKQQNALAAEYENAALMRMDAVRLLKNGEIGRGDMMAVNAWELLNYDRGTDGAARLSDEQRHALEGVAAQEGTLDERTAAYHQAIRDNLIENRDHLLEQRRAAHNAAEDKRINGSASKTSALDGFSDGFSVKTQLYDHKVSSNEEIQRLQDAVDENNNIWGKLSGKHGKAQDALKDFKAESDAELKQLEEEAKPRPFDEKKANEDLDALISEYSDAADASQKVLDEARQKVREEGAEKVRALREQAEKQEQALKQSSPTQAPAQKPEPTQVPEQKKPEQPSRDQVPPAQEPPVQKPEPQQVPEQPQPSPEKPVQKPDAPIQQGDQPLPPREPAQNKPPEQPSSRPDNKAIPEQKGNPVNPGKPGQTNADGKQGELPKLKDGPPKIDSYVRDDNGRYKKPNEGKTAFIDKGDAGVSVRRPTSNSDLGAAMKLLQQKGANNIQLNGSDDFKKRAWIEANARGMKTKGYEPTQEDKRAMQNRAEQLRKVSEMNGVNRGASQTLGARQNQGGRKPREEDQPPPPPPKPTQGSLR